MTKYTKRLTQTTVLLISILLSIFLLVPSTHFFSQSNPILPKHELGLKSSTNYNPTGVYDWSNFTSFTYRIPLEINSTYMNRTDYSVKIDVNFTQVLIESGWSGEFDKDSVRVVEYEGIGPYYPKLFNVNEVIEMNKYVIPSLFIPLEKYDNYHAEINAFGQLWFELPGKSIANTNRTFMIYFDTIENTGGYLATPDSLIWKKDYNYKTDVIGDKKFHLAYGNLRDNVAENRGKLTIWNDDLSDTIYYGRPHSDIQRYLDPIPGDFNGDGEVELLVNDRENQFWLMDYNPVTGLFIPLQTENGDPLDFESLADSEIAATSWTHYSVYAADIDNDGSDEIITMNRYDIHNYIVIYNITLDAQLNHVLNIQEYWSTGEIGLQAMVLADMDHNGFLDIIAADVDGDYYDRFGYTVYFWMNNGTGEYEHFNITQEVKTGHGGILPQEVRSISAGDIDNDGNIELVMSDHDNNHYIYIWQMNETGQMEHEGTFNIPSDPNFRDPVVGAMYDWDYDGYTEIIIGNSDSYYNSSIAVIKVKGLANQTDSIVQEFVWGQWGNTSVPYHDLYYPRFGDLDNDNEIEMFAGSYRRYDSALGNLPEPSILVWNQSSTIIDWISPSYYSSVGSADSNSQTMMTVFGAWDNYVYRQNPLHYLYTGKAKSPDLTIHILDMDMGPVFNASVTITLDGFSDTKHTDQNGMAIFELLNDGSYTVNVYYSTSYYSEELVYVDSSLVIDSSSQLYAEETYVVPLQKIYFDVTDINGGDFTAGNLVVWNQTKGGAVGDNMSLGTNLEYFTWIARSSYDVSVLYLNNNYKNPITYVNDTTILPVGNETSIIRDFNSTGMIDLGGNDYQFVFEFEVDELLNWINIDLSSVTDYIDSVSVQLIFDLGEDMVYYEDISGTSTQDWTGSIPLWSDSSGIMRLDSLRSNKVRVIILGHNTTTNDGTIEVDLYHQAVESINIPFAEVELNFIDGDDVPAEGFAIQIYDTEIDRLAGNHTAIVNLTTNEYGDALDADGNPFYYFTKSPENYSLMAVFYRQARTFSSTGQNYANFTFSAFDSFQFQVTVQVQATVYTTNITLQNTLATSVDFDQDYYAHIRITANDSIEVFDIEADPFLKIYSVKTNSLVYQEHMVTTGTKGYYDIIFNPQADEIILGDADYSYYIIIEANTPGYGAGPLPIVSSLTINPISTSVSFDQIVAATWTDIATFDIIYEDRESIAISGAYVSYDAPWLFDTVVVPESGTPGIYSVSIDTTDPGNVGDYILKFTAFKNNYLIQQFDVRLSIRPLATSLNDTNPADFLLSYVTPRVNLTQSYPIYFEYTVAGTGDGITGATVTCFVDYTYVNGTKGSETLLDEITELGNGVYELNYNTESLPEGIYEFDIKFEKLNHDAKVASVTLEMVKNQFNYAFTSGNFDNNVLKFTIPQGDSATLSLDLTKKLNGEAADNASVVFITSEGQRIDFTYQGDGIYTYLISGDINTFIQKQIVEGTIEITADYYETYTFTVQVTVQMHSLFAEIPTFYFVLGVAFVVVGVGAIVLTKAVQNSRIPEFVKKCDAVAKEISKKKTIDTRTSVVKDKKEKLIEIFSKDWEDLGLDFRKAIGTKSKEPAEKQPSEEVM
ncbi:MAG: VCBS repeat-containing protein [Candidatus Lokiarchaeota archaeon]|nr:VCBS repeat-containing protein [Candidatus Lokiarchaeota archaeon]